MKIKDQAAEALRIDPFAKTFICDKPCKGGRGGFERYVINGFKCVTCQRKKNLDRIAADPEKHKERQREYLNKNRDYVLMKARADWHRRKEAQLAAV